MIHTLLLATILCTYRHGLVVQSGMEDNHWRGIILAEKGNRRDLDVRLPIVRKMLFNL